MTVDEDHARSLDTSAERMPPPVFVVGSPRAGTTLLAAMLAAHSRIACGPETQFFSKTRPEARRAAVADPHWPEKAVELLLAITLSGAPVHELFGRPRAELAAYLDARQPSEQALLEAFTAAHAERLGKPRWAEKTPNHLRYVHTLRALYPRAPIIQIVRDPRDVSRSMRKLPWASSSVLANAYLWRAWFEESYAFFQQDVLSLVVRFEDLLTAPESTLRRICAFIGELYDEQMLDRSASAPHVITEQEPWKQQVAGPLDPTQTAKWKQHLPPPVVRAIGLVCRRGMEAFGYDGAIEPERTIRTYGPIRDFVEAHEAELIALAEMGTILEPTREIVPHPDASDDDDEVLYLDLHGLGGTRKERFEASRQFIWSLLQRRLNNRPVRFLPSSVDEPLSANLRSACLLALSTIGKPWSASGERGAYSHQRTAMVTNSQER